MSRPLAKRAVIRLEPTSPEEDAIAFLQGLVTNDVKSASTAKPVYAALLSPQGKMQYDFFIWPATFEHGPGLLLDCEKATADDLAKRLSLYRLRRKLAIAVDPDRCVTWAPPATPEEEAKGNDPRLSALGFRGLLNSPCGKETADSAYLAHRLAHGVPEGRREMADVLWLETNAVELNGVSFTKGCYIGQENTARMNWRQKVNRRLVVVPLSVSRPDRRKAAYEELELAVDHLKVDDIPPSVLPGWLRQPADGPVDGSGDKPGAEPA